MTTERTDEETAVALQKAGIPVASEEDMAKGLFQYQAAIRKQTLTNEKNIKGFYVDWLFDKLNLVKYR